MRNITAFFIISLASVLFASCTSKSDANSELMKCDKPWSERTEFEKIIGKWCGEKYQPGVGRTIVSQTIKFQNIMCFYSDHTMKEFQRSESYINGEDEMDSGTNVQIKNGILTYISAKYGSKSFNVSVSETRLKIDGKISISMSDTYSKCN